MSNNHSSPLLLKSLEVENFRGFNHLQIDTLTRVNLIVGKNNIGKTTLLEALQIYAEKGNPETLASILELREETASRRARLRPSSDIDDIELAIRSLFYKREMGSERPFFIGLVDTQNARLSVALKRYIRQTDESGNVKFVPSDASFLESDEEILRIAIQFDNQPENSLSFSFFERRPRSFQLGEQLKNVFVRSNGLSAEETATLWDNTTLTEGEENVLQALRLIDQRVERLNLVGTPTSQRARVAQVSLKDGEGRIPLRSLGDGMSRLFGVSLALVNSNNGLLMIDEIDTGLHYSVLTKLWHLVFEVARKLNIQVFATTHSWDCIQAFQTYLSESDLSDGQVISLRKRSDEEGAVNAVLWDKRRLSIATKSEIEVR